MSSASEADSGSDHVTSDPDVVSDGEPAAIDRQQKPAKRKLKKAPTNATVKGSMKRAKAQPPAAPAEKRQNPANIESMLVEDVQPQHTAVFAMEKAASTRRKAAPAAVPEPEVPSDSKPSAAGPAMATTSNPGVYSSA